MSEFRRGATNNRWVIIAPERGCRPSDFEQRRIEYDAGPNACPFCAGNEDMTPSELYRDPAPDGRGWHVRVIPNKYPALMPYADSAPEPISRFFERRHGVGTHEVIIESPVHNHDIPDFCEEQMIRIVEAYSARFKVLMENLSFRYVLLFRNHGTEAGASLLHPHSQIIATSIVPQQVRSSLRIAKAYYERKERCLFCDLMLAELRNGERIVDENDDFVTWTPYDSRFPFEIVIYPRAHSHDFSTMADHQKVGLARTLILTTRRLRSLLGDVPYNLVIETTPSLTARPGSPGSRSILPHAYHWHIAVIPRLTRVAGFELGTGFYINPMPPEEAAKHLRDAAVQGIP
jgi:UDPglucose--hexose-1-phosphate uridylyltransferase